VTLPYDPGPKHPQAPFDGAYGGARRAEGARGDKERGHM
jgi:hypothetical protein